MNNIDCFEILEFGKKLAFDAGEIIKKERSNKSFKNSYKNGIELVTSADIATDKFITGEILKKYPEHKIFSEEMYSFISPEDLASNCVWIIDPIDGTVNYANNQLHVAISIAFAVNGKVKTGIVYSPFQNEIYYAVKGRGAYLNGQRIKAAEGISIQNALIATGFSYEKKDRMHQIELLKKILMQCQDVRRLGAAALDLCYVACGRLAGYYESVKSWDMAAGALIATEAGAKIGHLNSVTNGIPEELRGEGLIVASTDVYEDLLRILKS